MSDYRNTKYCKILSGVDNKKQTLVCKIKNDHPRAVDMHTYISPNTTVRKTEFMDIYNGKCAYCGVSISLIPRTMFEIDHIIYKKSFPTKKDAGYIENLTLACHLCNNKKHDFLIPSEDLDKLHPDKELIKSFYIRNKNNYYIELSDEAKKHSTLVEFYYKLQLDGEIHRIDYLLMNMIGIMQKHKDNDKLCSKLGQALIMLQEKRNRI